MSTRASTADVSSATEPVTIQAASLTDRNQDDRDPEAGVAGEPAKAPISHGGAGSQPTRIRRNARAGHSLPQDAMGSSSPSSGHALHQGGGPHHGDGGGGAHHHQGGGAMKPGPTKTRGPKKPKRGPTKPRLKPKRGPKNPRLKPGPNPRLKPGPNPRLKPGPTKPRLKPPWKPPPWNPPPPPPPR
jgi:hypothetical protein